MCKFINADDFGYLGANDDFIGFNLYAYCSNNPVMNVDPMGHSIWNFVLAIAFIVDTIVETSILMNKEEDKVDSVYDGSGEVIIPNSAYFNNPIAQEVYSKYLYENVKNEDDSNYFDGDVYDITGEWRAHNIAYWSLLLGLGKVIADQISYTERAKHVNLGSNLEVENVSGRKPVYYVSEGLKWIHKIFTFNRLNWGD